MLVCLTVCLFLSVVSLLARLCAFACFGCSFARMCVCVFVSLFVCLLAAFVVACVCLLVFECACLLVRVRLLG